MKQLVLILASVLLLVSPCFAMQGDIDNSGKIELQDAVLGLQVTAGLRTTGYNIGADVNNDSVIGLPEVIYDLRILAGITAGKARAMLGPLSDAIVNVYRLNDMTTAIYTTTTDDDGYFATTSVSVGSTDFIIVSVSGGLDRDANDDGVRDLIPTLNNGTIYAMMTAEQFAAGNFVVSAITDIAYQYTKNLIGQADKTWLQTRLNDVAKNFFVSDLNGDGAIDSKDLLMFVPTDDNHKSKLNFDYQQLFDWNDEHNYSIMKCYHYDMRDTLLTMLDYKFGSRLSLNPAPDTRYQKVKIEVAAFGKGSVKSDVGGIDIDSARTNAADNVKYAFFDPSATGKVVLTATPKTDTQIMSWNGCDTVSQDKTRCESNLRENRLISITFGYKEAKLKDGVVLVDLTKTLVNISSDMITLDVTANSGDTDMAAKLAALKAGNIVVGPAEGGFLRRVVSVQKVSDYNYILTTNDVSLTEIVAQGTGFLYKEMTYGDLEQSTSVRSVRSGSQSTGFQAIDGVRLLPSDDPNDKVFKLVIGDSRNTRGNVNFEDTVKWTTDTGINLILKGTIDVGISIETGLSYSYDFPWDVDVEYFKFIPHVTAEEKIEVLVGDEMKTSDKKKTKLEKKIATLPFTPIYFAIGPVPVWLKPEVSLYLGLEAEISGGIALTLTLKETASGGIVYNRNTDPDTNTPTEFNWSFEFDPPDKITLSGELKPYIKTSPVVYIYGLTGPAINLKGYYKIKSDGQLSFTDACATKLSSSQYVGIEADFEWELEKLKKLLGGWSNKLKLDFKLFEKERLIAQRNLGGCDMRPPFMQVEGSDINKVAVAGSGMVIPQHYTVKNTGDTKMDWEILYFEDPAIIITPKSGSLEKGETATISVSVDAGMLKVGKYHNRIQFKNKYQSALFDEPNGSQERRVTITVTRPPLAAPVMSAQSATTSAGSVIPTIVNLSWSYPDAATLEYVKGYDIYMTQDIAGTWQKLATVSGSISTYQVPNLQPNTTYYFKADVFGDYVSGNISGAVSIKTPTAYVPPSGSDFTNSLGMSFKLIPAGTFMMGSPTSEWGRNTDETQHQVTLSKSFYMQTTEVTQGQWKAVMGSNPSYFTACGDNCPVEQVSWNDVQTFLTAMNSRGEGTYRLPTEAEWEYAARANSTTAFYNGGITYTGTGYSPVDPNLNLIGWYYGNCTVTYTPNSSGKGTHQVGQKQANAWGLYDMTGNVWEWCQGWYGTYPTSAVTDPTGPSSGSYRVMRGGSWNNYAQNCRSAYRPSYSLSSRSSQLGFRLVRESYVNN